MNSFSGVLLVDQRGWLLLQERDEFPAIDPEKWGLVGGHIEKDEDFESGAYRELEEETGIRLAPPALALWREVEVYHEVYDSHDRMNVYVAPTQLTDADIVVGEGRQIVFVDPEQAGHLDLTQAAGMIVPAFLTSDLYRSMCP